MIRVRSIGVKFPESFMYQTLLKELVGCDRNIQTETFLSHTGHRGAQEKHLTLSATCSRSVYYDNYTKIQTRCLATNGTERGQSQEVT